MTIVVTIDYIMRIMYKLYNIPLFRYYNILNEVVLLELLEKYNRNRISIQPLRHCQQLFHLYCNNTLV